MDASQAATVAKDLLASFWTENNKLDRIDRWARWEHDDPHRPQHATREYRELAARAQVPWGDLVVTSVSQMLYVDGYRRPDAPEDSSGWGYWQANKMDARQVAIHKAALTYGLAYTVVLPGLDPLTGAATPAIRGVSPREMLAVYDDPAWDDWPRYALRVRSLGKSKGFDVRVYDATTEFRFSLAGKDEALAEVSVADHGVGVCPVVRYANRFDLEGRAAGEIEPFIPLLGSIDQTKFDRLVVQRFASWIVRTIAGMSVVDSAAATGSSPDAVKMRLKVEDLLTAEDKDTKFGSLPATPLDGFIRAHEADLSSLAAVSQTPAFEMLGTIANLSAEALAAAKASQTAKADERRQEFGESHEQTLQLAAAIAGDAEGAADYAAQVRWKDTSIRSLAQAVDALGKMATMLGFPPELLWAKVPGITQQDVDEARQRLAEMGGVAGVDRILAELGDGMTSPPAPAMDPAEVKARADALGVLVRSGVEAEAAARIVGLAGVEFTGAVPVSLRLPEPAAAGLEQA